MQASLSPAGEQAPESRLTSFFLFALSAAGLLTGLLIVLGWIPLGERIDISRRDLNGLEWTVTFIALAFAVVAFRAAWGVYTNEESGMPWARWVSFIAIWLGVVITMNAVVPQFVTYAVNVTSVNADNVVQALNPLLIASGLILTFGSLAFYRYATRNVSADDSKVEKAQGAFGTALEDMTPGQLIRFQLAQSPSAGAIIGFVAIFFFFSISSSLFLLPDSIASILTNVSTRGIIAIGVTILMISGEFDLSVGSMLGAVAMFFMLFMTEGVPVLGIPPVNPWIAMGMTLMVGVFFGFINGFILIRTGIPSFIVTLGTLLAYRAIPLVAIPGGRILRYRDYYDEFPTQVVQPWFMALLGLIGLLTVLFVAYRTLPPRFKLANERWQIQHENGHFGTTIALWGWFVALASTVILGALGIYAIMFTFFHLGNLGDPYVFGFFDMVNGRWGFTLEQTTNGLLAIDIPRTANFRNSIIWWVLLAFFFHTVMTQTSYGNAVLAVGGNPGAARANGINVDRVKIYNFMLVGFLVGVSAIFEVTRNPAVAPLIGLQWELEVIAMTVIGGALLTGGYGSVLGTVLGALIFGMLQTGLVLIGMNARLFEGVVGVILVVAVILNTLVRNIPNK